MEDHKNLKPFFSQAADRLNERILQLIGTDENALDATSTTMLGKVAIKTVDESSEFPQLNKHEYLSATNSSGLNVPETHDYAGKTIGSQGSDGGNT